MNARLLWMGLFCCLTYFTNGQKIETIFDRKEHLSDKIMPVPEIARLEESLGITGRFEWVRGINLWVERQGEGIPLVLVSGGPGTSHHYFHPHFQEATKFSEVIFYDLRGVGLSDRISGSEGYSIDQAVEDLDALREKLGFEKWAVLGLSFGGVVTQLYALKYPERIAGMILLSSALPMSLDIGLGARQYDFLSEAERKRIGEIYSIAGQRVAPVHTEQLGPELQRSMLFNAFSNGDWKRRHIKRWYEDDIAMYARYEFVHDKGYYQAMLQDYFEYDFKGLFKTCPVPTLIIEGKWDLAYGEQKAEMMFDQFQKADREFWEDTGHLAFEDEPERFMKTLRKFLENLPQVSPSEIQEWKKTFSPADYRKPNQLQREFLRRR